MDEYFQRAALLGTWDYLDDVPRCLHGYGAVRVVRIGPLGPTLALADAAGALGDTIAQAMEGPPISAREIVAAAIGGAFGGGLSGGFVGMLGRGAYASLASSVIGGSYDLIAYTLALVFLPHSMWERNCGTSGASTGSSTPPNPLTHGSFAPFAAIP